MVYPLENGQIRRIGAGLDLYDEDTLIAILQLAAEKKLVGPPEFMPVALPPVKNNNTTVYRGKVSAGAINNFLCRSDGGSDLCRTRESIKRLANQRLWFEGVAEEKEMEGVTDFFKYTGPSDLKGDLLIQISPEMVNLLKSYEVIDMRIRRKLNDCGKAVHRFLAPQLRELSIKFDDLAKAILYEKGGNSLKRSLIGRKETGKENSRPNQLDFLVELGFLQEWSISGTGRKKPFVLSIVKNRINETKDKTKVNVDTVSSFVIKGNYKTSKIIKCNLRGLRD